MEVTRNNLKQICNNYNVSIREGLLLLQDVLCINYTELFFKNVILLSELQYSLFIEYIQRRSNSEPISKIVGYKYFYNNKFYTNRFTLDPRPETELIVELFSKYYTNTNEYLKILDLGCGTGCIGLSIILLYNNAELHLVDISQKALEVAEINAKSLKVIDRCKLIRYKLDKEVLYDPPEALFAGIDGMDAYNIILPNASLYLKNKGKIFIEIGYNQMNKIKQIKTDLKIIEITKDLNNINRIFTFCKK